MYDPLRIRIFRESDLPGCLCLWNRLSDQDPSFVYKSLDEEKFHTLFTQSVDRWERALYVAEYEGGFAGFAGSVRSAEKAFLTAVVVRPDIRRCGIGSRLLERSEAFILEQASPDKYEVIFFNPSPLPWIVPGTDGHDHPNAPGVDVASGAYLFLKNRGFRDTVYQNSFYLPLDQYCIPPSLEEGEARLASEGITIAEYDSQMHSGFSELFDNLESGDWRDKVMQNIKRGDRGDPVMIVQRGGRIYGFAGPVRPEESGRGYFAGIGVHTDLRGKGAGKLLFARLCMKEREVGSHFMTFFTGENNPARNIYETAGFKIVRTWADMAKPLKNS